MSALCCRVKLSGETHRGTWSKRSSSLIASEALIIDLVANGERESASIQARAKSNTYANFGRFDWRAARRWPIRHRVRPRVGHWIGPRIGHRIRHWHWLALCSSALLAVLRLGACFESGLHRCSSDDQSTEQRFEQHYRWLCC